MKKTQVIAILDRSGSMSGSIDEAVGAFNGFIEDLVKEEVKADVTLVAFDDQIETVFDKVPVNALRKLTVDDVPPRGMTALYDAIGTAVTNAKDSKKTIVLVLTDGMENSSREYTNSSVKGLLDNKKSIGWDVKFVGADFNAFSVTNGLGIDPGSVFNSTKTRKGYGDTRNFFATNTVAYANSDS